jgi:hypothetical protein
MKSNGIAYQLPTLALARYTTETGGGAWPTPSANQAGEGDFIHTLQTKSGEPAEVGQRAYNPKTGKHSQITLNRAVKMWPTPNASDNRDRGNMSDPAIQRRIAKGKQVGLSMAVKEKKGGGTLNPTWVSWLMGYPLDWLELED